MSVSYSLWYNVFKKHCHTKAFEVQNDPTRSASLINLFELGRIVHFGTPEGIRTSDLPLRSMAYHVIHGSDVTSNIIPYAE